MIENKEQPTNRVLPELGEGRAYEKGYLVTWTAPRPEIELKQEKPIETKDQKSEG